MNIMESVGAVQHDNINNNQKHTQEAEILKRYAASQNAAVSVFQQYRR